MERIIGHASEMSCRCLKSAAGQSDETAQSSAFFYSGWLAKRAAIACGVKYDFAKNKTYHIFCIAIKYPMYTYPYSRGR